VSSREQNRQLWSTYDWRFGGEEWSARFGTTANLWHATLLPRIGGYLGDVRAIEIGAGHGRLSRYLKEACRSLVLADMVASCVDACRVRFADDARVGYLVNDGASLAGVADASIDFAFSFDSLVHADLATVAAYLVELERVLSPRGVAVLHHSNMAAVLALPAQGWSTHMRAADVSAAAVAAAAAERPSLECSGQELLAWGPPPALTDCISTFRKTTAPSRSVRRRETPDFFHTASQLASLSRWYGEVTPADPLDG
jgi:SAM-dependent methyltransferase